MEVHSDDAETLERNRRAIRDIDAREMIEERIASGKMTRLSPDQMEATMRAIPDAEIEAWSKRKNRRQMKFQFGLVDKKLPEKELTRKTATPQQIEAALEAISDTELEDVLTKERERTDAILKAEQEARAARSRAEAEKNGGGQVTGRPLDLESCG
jgi:hypothetical protein